jgi:hypothetical protein
MSDIKKKQTMRYTDHELAVIKATFAENDILVSAIRKVFLQAELYPEEKESLKFFKDDAVKVLKKTFLPEIDANAPLFQLVDPYLTLGNETKDKPLEDFVFYLKAREIVVDYIAQQFTTFENTLPTTSIRLSDLIISKGMPYSELHDVQIRIYARNYILSYVDSQINQLIFLAGLKTETVDQTIERLKKNSTK